MPYAVLLIPFDGLMLRYMGHAKIGDAYAGKNLATFVQDSLFWLQRVKGSIVFRLEDKDHTNKLRNKHLHKTIVLLYLISIYPRICIGLVKTAQPGGWRGICGLPDYGETKPPYEGGLQLVVISACNMSVGRRSR